MNTCETNNLDCEYFIMSFQCTNRYGVKCLSSRYRLNWRKTIRIKSCLRRYLAIKTRLRLPVSKNKT